MMMTMMMLLFWNYVCPSIFTEFSLLELFGDRGEEKEGIVFAVTFNTSFGRNAAAVVFILFVYWLLNTLKFKKKKP